MTTKSQRAATPSADPIELGTVTTWPLDRLAMSPLNVRKIGALEAIEPLAEDIRAKGLLQSLIVHPGPAGPDDPGRLIAGGQRRYLALLRLAKEGALAADALVPVREVPEELAVEASLAENIQRQDMNPADEAIAFAALLETGTHDARTIATRFGLDERHVKRRIKIASLAEPILEALKVGKISVTAAEAYAAAEGHDLQVKLFKMCEKDTWRGHKADSIISAIRSAGISADSPVGIFIGGSKAYTAAGGTLAVDDAYGPLFYDKDDKKKDDLQLRDPAIVSGLVAAAKAQHAAAAMKLATKIYPFVSGFEWAQNLAGGYDMKPPKPAKGSGLIVVSSGYATSGEDLRKRVKKAVDKHGATAHAIVFVDRGGKLAVADGCFVVGKDGWDKTEPKKRTESYGGMTDEEREAHNRNIEIGRAAAKMFGRSLLGETPGWGVTLCGADRSGRIEVHLISLEPSDQVEITEDQWRNQRALLKNEALEPFIERATEQVDAAIAEKAAAKAEAEAAEKAAAEKAPAALAELEMKPIAEWPALVVLTLLDHGVNYEIQRKEREDGTTFLHCIGPEGDDWESDNVLETVQLIRDATVGNTWTIEVVDELPPEEPAEAEPTGSSFDTEPVGELVEEAAAD